MSGTRRCSRAGCHCPCRKVTTAIVAVLEGDVVLASGAQLGDGASAVYGALGGDIELTVRAPTTLLVMTGVPIDEPIAGYGPFVMNTREEIIAAFEDVNAGRFGRLGAQGASAQ